MTAAQFWFAGECMLEMLPAEGANVQTATAGDSYNTAVYFKRLLPREVVHYVSALGHDMLSQRLRHEMRDHGIADTLVAALPGRLPGLYLIETDAGGERRFHYWRAQSAARDMLAGAHLRQVEGALPDCRCLYLTGITLAILDVARREALLALAAEVRRRGGWVVVDNNYRATLWPADEARQWLGRALALATHALLGFDDEAELYGDAHPRTTLARLRDNHGQEIEIVLKHGAAGCLVAPARISGAASVFVAAPPVRAVVDTTAAGDSFNAAYLAARHAGRDPVAAGEAGCRLAARVVGQRGAIIAAALMADLAAGWRAGASSTSS